jgi:hypothetical protein
MISVPRLDISAIIFFSFSAKVASSTLTILSRLAHCSSALPVMLRTQSRSSSDAAKRKESSGRSMSSFTRACSTGTRPPAPAPTEAKIVSCALLFRLGGKDFGMGLRDSAAAALSRSVSLRKPRWLFSTCV